MTIKIVFELFTILAGDDYFRTLMLATLAYSLDGDYLISIFLMLVQYVHYLQRKYALGSFNLLGHTALAQAASLLLLGPFLDYWLTSKRVDAYNCGFASVVCFVSYLF